MGTIRKNPPGETTLPFGRFPGRWGSSPALDFRRGACQLCSASGIVLEFDTSSGEYAAGRICKACLDTAWELANRTRREAL